MTDPTCLTRAVPAAAHDVAEQVRLDLYSVSQES